MEIFKKKKILAVFHDAGAANIGLNYLKEKKIDTKFYCTGPSYKILKSLFPNKKNIKNLYKELKKYNLIITGTSSSNKIEFNVRRYCKKNKIFCVTFLDHWVNYKKRFTNNRVKVLPDVLVSSDNKSYKICKKIFKKTAIVKCINYYEKKIIEKIRRLKKGEKILYFLEPFNNKIEFVALKIFFQKLKKLKIVNQSIILKTHPSENKNKYIKFLKKYEKFKILLDNKSSIEKLISSAKYIFGLESNALAISQKVNKKVFTILPLYNRKFRLPFKKIKNINKFKKF